MNFIDGHAKFSLSATAIPLYITEMYAAPISDAVLSTERLLLTKEGTIFTFRTDSLYIVKFKVGSKSNYKFVWDENDMSIRREVTDYPDSNLYYKDGKLLSDSQSIRGQETPDGISKCISCNLSLLHGWFNQPEYADLTQVFLKSLKPDFYARMAYFTVSNNVTLYGQCFVKYLDGVCYYEVFVSQKMFNLNELFITISNIEPYYNSYVTPTMSGEESCRIKGGKQERLASLSMEFNSLKEKLNDFSLTKLESADCARTSNGAVECHTVKKGSVYAHSIRNISLIPNTCFIVSVAGRILYKSTPLSYNFKFPPRFLIKVLALILEEERIVFISKHNIYEKVQYLLNLLDPFDWCHFICAPLPEEMASILESPFPFIVGIEECTGDKKNSIESTNQAGAPSQVETSISSKSVPKRDTHNTGRKRKSAEDLKDKFSHEGKTSNLNSSMYIHLYNTLHHGLDSHENRFSCDLLDDIVYINLDIFHVSKAANSLPFEKELLEGLQQHTKETCSEYFKVIVNNITLDREKALRKVFGDELKKENKITKCLNKIKSIAKNKAFKDIKTENSNKDLSYMDSMGVINNKTKSVLFTTARTKPNTNGGNTVQIDLQLPGAEMEQTNDGTTYNKTAGASECSIFPCSQNYNKQAKVIQESQLKALIESPSYKSANPFYANFYKTRMYLKFITSLTSNKCRYLFDLDSKLLFFPYIKLTQDLHLRILRMYLRLTNRNLPLIDIEITKELADLMFRNFCINGDYYGVLKLYDELKNNNIKVTPEMYKSMNRGTTSEVLIGDLRGCEIYHIEVCECRVPRCKWNKAYIVNEETNNSSFSGLPSNLNENSKTTSNALSKDHMRAGKYNDDKHADPFTNFSKYKSKVYSLIKEHSNYFSSGSCECTQTTSVFIISHNGKSFITRLVTPENILAYVDSGHTMCSDVYWSIIVYCMYFGLSIRWNAEEVDYYVLDYGELCSLCYPDIALL